MATIPYPPAPEPGWYADDPVDKPAAVSSAAAEPSPVSSSTASHAAKGSSDGDIEDWDSTVLSSSFTAKAPRKIYILHNDATGQTIVIDKSTLLGRKPSMDVPEGAKAEKVEDPTRTTSRNHAAISIDQNGTLWIEDYGSLNGTYIIRDGQEAQVLKGKPRKLDAPATLYLREEMGGADFVKCLLLFYGWFGLTDSSSMRLLGGPWDGLTEEDWQFYLNLYAEDPAALAAEPYANLFLNDLTHDVPACYIAAAEFDPLRDDSATLAAICEQYGTPFRFELFEGVIHAFLHYTKMLDAANDVLEHGATFYRETLGLA